MLTIRPEQLERLNAAAKDRFAQRLMAHVRESWPDDHDALGGDKTLDLVREGIREAEGYGITSEYGVAGYVDLMFALGPGFDRDPELSWAQAILANRDWSERTKIDTMEQCAIEVLEGDHGGEPE